MRTRNTLARAHAGAHYVGATILGPAPSVRTYVALLDRKGRHGATEAGPAERAAHKEAGARVPDCVAGPGSRVAGAGGRRGAHARGDAAAGARDADAARRGKGGRRGGRRQEEGAKQGGEAVAYFKAEHEKEREEMLFDESSSIVKQSAATRLAGKPQTTTSEKELEGFLKKAQNEQVGPARHDKLGCLGCLECWGAGRVAPRLAALAAASAVMMPKASAAPDLLEFTTYPQQVVYVELHSLVLYVALALLLVAAGIALGKACLPHSSGGRDRPPSATGGLPRDSGNPDAPLRSARVRDNSTQTVQIFPEGVYFPSTERAITAAAPANPCRTLRACSNVEHAPYAATQRAKSAEGERERERERERYVRAYRKLYFSYIDWLCQNHKLQTDSPNTYIVLRNNCSTMIVLPGAPTCTFEIVCVPPVAFLICPGPCYVCFEQFAFYRAIQRHAIQCFTPVFPSQCWYVRTVSLGQSLGS